MFQSSIIIQKQKQTSLINTVVPGKIGLHLLQIKRLREMLEGNDSLLVVGSVLEKVWGKV